MTDAVVVEGLHKSYGKTMALDGVDLAVPEGTIVGLLGPNGAGKTTVVRILATLLRADAGRAEVGGLDVVKDANAVRSMIGLTGQYAAVDEYLTGFRTWRWSAGSTGWARHWRASAPTSCSGTSTSATPAPGR